MGPDPKTTPNPNRTIAICAALLGLFYLLGYLSMRVKSATVDEPLHAGAAYHHTFDRDFRVNPEDPPLWKYWAMIPHRAGELRPDPDQALWDTVLENVTYEYAVTSRRLFQIPGNNGAEFINTSRCMMLLLGVALGAALAAWAWQIAGPTAAVVACLLFSLDPNFLGHAPLVKNDVCLSLLMLLVAWATWSVGRQARWWNLLLLCAGCAAAVAVKFSGLLLGPMVAVMLLTRAMLSMAWRWTMLGRELTTRASRLLAVAVLGIAALAGSVLIVWASYGFRFEPTAVPGAMLNMPFELRRLRQSVAYVNSGLSRMPSESEAGSLPEPTFGRAIAFAERHRLMPQAWLYGLLYTYRSTLYRETFLLGERGEMGWWYYFPLTIVFKTPLATLAAMAIVTMALARGTAKPQAASPGSWDAICVALPILIYGVSALTTHLNLGLRHVLPVFPFMYLLVGTGAAKLRISRPRVFTPVAIVLGLGLLIESFGAFPNYLSYFNAPSRPYRLKLLSDSNFDWGQDLPHVAQWQQRHQGVTLYLGYFGWVDPEFYGVRYANLPGGFKLNPQSQWPPTGSGVIAVSATLLQGLNCPEEYRDVYESLRDRKPRAVLGDTIYLYDWPLR